MNLRFTSIESDHWALVSAEVRHQEAPETFAIPPAGVRNSLRRGDAAKLLFDIETREGLQVIDRGVDRMWVIVTDFDGTNYIGILTSDPGKADGLNLMRGSEVLFSPEHICEVDRPPDEFLRKEFGERFIAKE